MKEIQERKGNLVFWSGLIFCTVYLSYRYPLQINSTGTSPTYSDTPLMWQAGKFLLVCPLFAIAAVRCFRKLAPLKHWLIALTVLFLSCYSLFKFCGDDNTRYIELSFWMLFSLVLVWGIDAVHISAIDQFFKFLLAYALGSTLIEVFLFAAFGRLPALAWGGTFMIRFGGFLDDPNGFAAILFLLLGWSYKRFKGRVRFFTVGGIVVSLFLTQSWTALAFLMLISFCWALLGISRRPFLAIAIICICILSVVLVVRLVPPTFFTDMLEAKEGSIEGHSVSWGQWISRWTEWAVLGDSTYNAYESWWASAPINFGLPWFIAFVCLIAELIRCLRKGLVKAGSEACPVYFGFLLFGIYFVFGSLSLPFPMIFPINFLFFVFSFLVAFGKIREEDCTPVRHTQVPLRKADVLW